MPQDSHVFVVDDDEGSRHSVEALVEAMNVSVHSYDSAESFLADYNNQRPACLVTDQRMPGMGGVELIENLRNRGLTLSIVVMTAFPDTRSTVRAMNAGAINLIEKPCNSQELWNAIQRGLNNDCTAYRQELELREARERLDELNNGERQVIEHLSQGIANKVIASKIGVSLRTVEARRASIFQKLQVTSIAEMMEVWIKSRQAN
ncbi:MAG: response regulator [Pirellulaceae bacterium]